MPVFVTAESLHDVFEKRLNIPETLPESFDAPQHKINRRLAGFNSRKYYGFVGGRFLLERKDRGRFSLREGPNLEART
jgi:hypothetical protein